MKIKELKLLINEELSKIGIKNKLVSLTSSDPVAKDIEQDIFDLINLSYKNLGGHVKIKSPSDIGKEYPNWMVADINDNPEVDVARLSSPSPETGGFKGGAVATDGSPEAKAKLYQMLKNFYSTPGNWSEVSGPMAGLLIKKLGLKPLSDEEKVRNILKNKEITWNGSENPETGDNLGVSGWYTRKIGGKEHTKIIVGNL